MKLLFGFCALLNLTILLVELFADKNFDGARFSALLGWSCAWMALEDK